MLKGKDSAAPSVTEDSSGPEVSALAEDVDALALTQQKKTPMLPPDILFMIVEASIDDALWDDYIPYPTKQYYDTLSTLKTWRLTNRKLHDFVTPLFFRNIVIGPSHGASQQFKNLLSAKANDHVVSISIPCEVSDYQPSFYIFLSMRDTNGVEPLTKPKLLPWMSEFFQKCTKLQQVVLTFGEGRKRLIKGFRYQINEAMKGCPAPLSSLYIARHPKYLDVFGEMEDLATRIVNLTMHDTVDLINMESSPEFSNLDTLTISYSELTPVGALCIDFGFMAKQMRRFIFQNVQLMCSLYMVTNCFVSLETLTHLELHRVCLDSRVRWGKMFTEILELEHLTTIKMHKLAYRIPIAEDNISDLQANRDNRVFETAEIKDIFSSKDDYILRPLLSTDAQDYSEFINFRDNLIERVRATGGTVPKYYMEGYMQQQNLLPFEKGPGDQEIVPVPSRYLADCLKIEHEIRLELAQWQQNV